MYEHPIKRAGISLNRIIFSNTRMVMAGFPQAKEQQFKLSFKHKAFENGRTVSEKGKYLFHLCFSFCLCMLVFTANDLDDCLPARVSMQ